MLKSNDGIILEDCLISFILISTFLLLMATYLQDVNELKLEMVAANKQLNNLKTCMLSNCDLSTGQSVYSECEQIKVGSHSKVVCVQI